MMRPNTPILAAETLEALEKEYGKRQIYDGPWLVAFMEAQMKRMLEISRAKNADYTGATADPFANFKNAEGLGIATEVGFVVRMSDKLARIASFVKQGTLQVKDESVKDTLLDLSNYCLLMAAYLESKKGAVK